MTNASDFDLTPELDATRGWDDTDDSTDSEDWESGYADEPAADGDDPEETSGDLDLAERYALRRVAGLSTELEDISEVEYRQLRLERVVLVGVWTEGTVQDAENSMAELALLAETAGSEVLDAIYQRRQRPDPATYIGRGKTDGVREIVAATGADTVICDGELAPSQLRNLEDRLERQGRRPDGADPRHLRPAREVEGGPGAGRAGAAELHEAAAAWLGWQPVATGGRTGRRRRWRHRRPWPR